MSMVKAEVGVNIDPPHFRDHFRQRTTNFGMALTSKKRYVETFLSDVAPPFLFVSGVT